eukprot:CAMPEP_0183505796 /NCGR_PEP_ID=MMETSP0371-20130417/6905_1 /TAXON_ID=268820 /ORGANISM="Peridinium aciculiferum, Strain PAER-2" /LENGTH=35 /DNA_ID= /DNA_START= /DNA_END= /DNA_ORIENTATION=
MTCAHGDCCRLWGGLEYDYTLFTSSLCTSPTAIPR